MEQHDEIGKHIYVAGPYKSRSLQATNQHISDMSGACELLLNYGFIPFFPHLYHFWDLIATRPEDKWMKLCCAWIDRCDIFTYLQTYIQYENSIGVEIEYNLASKLGLPIYPFNDLIKLLLEGKPVITRKNQANPADLCSFIPKRESIQKRTR